ncbi:MAG: hypothetical protein AAF327_11430, partial [Cyanobacteria bacterium P01_A01_bin.37]
NRQKIIYDAILFITVGLYIWGFMAVTQHMGSDLDIRGVRIRAYGSAAFVLLHVILSIGPLSRLNPSYQYLPESGASPPPFHEKIPTFEVKLKGDHILVYKTPNPPGTPVTPAVITEA